MSRSKGLRKLSLHRDFTIRRERLSSHSDPLASYYAFLRVFLNLKFGFCELFGDPDCGSDQVDEFLCKSDLKSWKFTLCAKSARPS